MLDLGAELSLPIEARSPTVGAVRLEAGSVSVINANNVLEHVVDLPALMTRCLALLKTGGEMHVEVPCEGSPTAWQDPTHVRAMNQNSWLYYTDWFWYLGWFEHRFAVDSSSWLDLQLKPCGREQAAFMRLVLRKVETTPAERTTARTMQSDLRLPDDAVATRSSLPSGGRLGGAGRRRRRPSSRPRRASPSRSERGRDDHHPHARSGSRSSAAAPTTRRGSTPTAARCSRPSIDKYCYITCRHLPPFFEHKHRIVYSLIENVKHWRRDPAPGGARRPRMPSQEQGLEIHHDGDLPARSGLGSSSSFTVGLLHALCGAEGPATWPRTTWPATRSTSSRTLIKENVGSQDQVAAAYGGFNRIDVRALRRVPGLAGDHPAAPHRRAAEPPDALLHRPLAHRLRGRRRTRSPTSRGASTSSIA